ncbi:hypothetical protein WMF30_06655 [Sorangium sp. So ce134]
MRSVISWATIAAAVVAQALITARLWRSELYSRKQKVAQAVLIWILPVVGSILVYAGLRQGDDVSRPTPNPEEEWDD